MAKKQKPKPDNLLAQNKKARHDYTIESTVEAGLVLTGTEIKSMRAGRLNLKDGYARIKDGEAWMENVHISPYKEGNMFNEDPLRTRKLLLHKQEIKKLAAAAAEQGKTLVPLRVYLVRGYAKVLIGVAVGKHTYDKRETLKRRDQDREIARIVKNNR